MDYALLTKDKLVDLLSQSIAMNSTVAQELAKKDIIIQNQNAHIQELKAKCKLDKNISLMQNILIDQYSI